MPAPRKGPNALLMVGIFCLGSASFMYLTNRRGKDPRHARKEFPGPLLGGGGEKVDIEPGKRGVW